VRVTLFTVWLLMIAAATASAQAPARPEPEEPSEPTTVFVHPDSGPFWLSGQLNIIFQSHHTFTAAYSGPNSFRASSEHATSTLTTLFTGVALPRRTEILFDVESAGGRGLSDALGLAGFSDLDVVRNPTLGAAPYLARLLVHHTIALSAEEARAARTPLSLATAVPVRRLDIRVGKFGTADFFDLNGVGGDSHLQFMNWTVDNNGAYDYAADTRGYTWGAIVEYQSPGWAIRFGEMLMLTVANGIELDWHVGRARAENVELEWRPLIHRRPATARVLSYVNHADMGDYREAVRRFERGADPVPTIEHTRQQGRIKYGVGVNAEQQVTSALRVFARSGWNEPHAESFAYTEVNNTFAVGADAEGRSWHRRQDRLGAAIVTNGLSEDHQAYLRLGGQGFLLGDGALTYGREDIAEVYYTAHVWRGVFASADVQGILHPGYNRDRGPLIIGGLRLHVDF
jgi:high affinity Mn2+ porin